MKLVHVLHIYAYDISVNIYAQNIKFSTSILYIIQIKQCCVYDKNKFGILLECV